MKPSLATMFGIDTTRMTNEELADVIRALSTELNVRINQLGGGWIKQLQAASLSIRSRTAQEQKNMRFE